ncbi:MAG: hypothetical protein R2850_11575 [Bacteroidia bacterium]
MKDEYKIKGRYSIEGGKTNEFEIEFNNLPENEENNKKLVEILHYPLRLIAEGGKLGVKGIKRFFLVLFLFAITNLFLLLYSVIRVVMSGFEMPKLVIVILVLLIGIGFTAYAAYRVYQFVMIDAMRVIYGNMTSFFKNLSQTIIEKAASIIQGKTEITDQKLIEALDFGKMIQSKYKNAPGILKKGITMILKRIPFTGIITLLKTDISDGRLDDASARLYSEMDGFITTTIFGNNNTRWVWWLLPLNIVALLVLIKLKLS